MNNIIFYQILLFIFFNKIQCVTPTPTTNVATTTTRMVGLRTPNFFYKYGRIWEPKAGLTWNYAIGIDDPNDITQYTKGEFDVIDIDLLETTKETINYLHSIGTKVICYLSAGTFEEVREEAQEMLNYEGLVGPKMEHWEGEYWVDIRHQVMKAIINHRLNLAYENGCDGVEFDNIDAYIAADELDIKREDQIYYNRWLANAAHFFYLSAGLKNCPELVEDLKNNFDFAINEECVDYEECSEYKPLLDMDKPVFTVLYPLNGIKNKKYIKKTCEQVKDLNLSVIFKDEDLYFDYERFTYDEYC